MLHRRLAEKSLKKAQSEREGERETNSITTNIIIIQHTPIL